VDLDAGGVQRDRLDLDAHDLGPLQFLEHAIEYTGLGPAVHARVDRVPVAEPFGQSTPLAAMLGHVEDGVDYLQVAQADIATLLGQTVLDGGELLGCDLHARDCPAQSQKSPLVLTRPSSGNRTNVLSTVRFRSDRSTVAQPSRDSCKSAARERLVRAVFRSSKFRQHGVHCASLEVFAQKIDFA